METCPPNIKVKKKKGKSKVKVKNGEFLERNKSVRTLGQTPVEIERPGIMEAVAC